ncbi:MAG: elongation factor 1-beta [Desulfurococcaceae archaeon]|jgi:elongation factor 1-beta|nr:elongation factor 1-beta [Desulfurococcaceae archaeon]
MARVAVVLKIYPEDVTIDLGEIVEKIKETLPPDYKLEMWDLEPVAFGIKVLRVLITMPENIEGGTEPLEHIISNIAGVSQVEVILVSRAPD